MSYILDALKKSDQERQQGASPNLYAVHGPTYPPGQDPAARRRLALWLAGGIVLALLCGLAFLLYQISRPLPAEPSSAASSPLATLSQSAAPPSDADPAATAGPQVAKQEQPSRPSAAIGEPRPPSSPKRKTVTAAPQPPLPLMAELSPSLQAAMPALKLAGHTYSSDPGQRMVIVNGKILRQGDTISPGIRLAEITWEGLIIEYRGTLFRVKNQ